MKNKLTDLNNHLFAQLERLGDETVSPEQIETEVKRAQGVVAVSGQIIQGAALVLEAAKLVSETGGALSRALPAVESLIGGAQPAAIEAKPQ